MSPSTTCGSSANGASCGWLQAYGGLHAVTTTAPRGSCSELIAAHELDGDPVVMIPVRKITAFVWHRSTRHGHDSLGRNSIYDFPGGLAWLAPLECLMLTCLPDRALSTPRVVSPWRAASCTDCHFPTSCRISFNLRS